MHDDDQTQPPRIACDTSGAGPHLLLVHGTGASGARWQPVRAALEARFTVHAMDRRGHGRSQDAADYAIDDEYDDIARCLKGISADPIDVVAHSYGGVCALGAARRGTAIRRLVLYEPPIPVAGFPYYPPDLIPAMRAALAGGEPEVALEAFLARVHGASPEDFVRMRRLSAWKDQVAGVAIALRELMAVDALDPRPADFAGWTTPTLLLLGGDSPPQYRATARSLAGMLPASRIEELAGQRHGAIGGAPELFCATVLGFLGGA